MTTKPLKILVTNDDGIEAQGINFLAEIMKDFGDIYVVGPQQHQSGMAHAITLQVPLRSKCIKDEEHIHIYSVSGTPVDCVKFGLDQLIPDNHADLIVAGINHGSNAASSSIYSGTVACVREGALNDIPSIAFSSLDFASEINFEPYRPFIRQIVETVLTKGLPKHVFLNVNFPKPDRNIAGMHVCSITKGLWVEHFIEKSDPQGRTYYWLSGEYTNDEPENTDSDEWRLSHDYIAIVPIRVEETDYETIQNLQELNTSL